MMHIARELCGGQICVTPDAAVFDHPETRKWMEKYYTVNDEWQADDRRKLLALARDLLNSDYAGPPAHLPAVRPVSALRPVRRRLPEFRLEPDPEIRAEGGGLSDNIWGVTKQAAE